LAATERVAVNCQNKRRGDCFPIVDLVRKSGATKVIGAKPMDYYAA
jgi:hypothetical protein